MGSTEKRYRITAEFAEYMTSRGLSANEQTVYVHCVSRAIVTTIRFTLAELAGDLDITYTAAKTAVAALIAKKHLGVHARSSGVGAAYTVSQGLIDDWSEEQRRRAVEERAAARAAAGPNGRKS